MHRCETIVDYSTNINKFIQNNFMSWYLFSANYFFVELYICGTNIPVFFSYLKRIDIDFLIALLHTD